MKKNVVSSINMKFWTIVIKHDLFDLSVVLSSSSWFYTVARATQKSRSMGSITLTIVFFCSSSYYSSQFLVFVVQSLHANVRDFLPPPLLPPPSATALLLRHTTTQNYILSRSRSVKSSISATNDSPIALMHWNFVVWLFRVTHS